MNDPVDTGLVSDNAYRSTEAELASAPDWPCGFWRRVAAGALDFLILGIVGYSLSLIWGSQFSRMGQNGRWIGFFIAGAYLIATQAHTGQSIGKAAFGLKVVGLDGLPMSVTRATLRYVVFAATWMLNGAHFAADGLPAVVIVVTGILLLVVVFGGWLGSFYLLVFNAQSRRLIHDWIAGTVVVRADTLQLPPDRDSVAMKRFHLTVIAIVLLGVFGVFLWLWMSFGARLGTLDTLQAIQRQISAIPGVLSVQVNENHAHNNAGDTRSLIVSMTLDPSVNAQRRNIALAAMRASLASWKHDAKDALVVRVVEGFDIGILSKWSSESEAHTASQWESVLSREGVHPAAR